MKTADEIKIHIGILKTIRDFEGITTIEIAHKHRSSVKTVLIKLRSLAEHGLAEGEIIRGKSSPWKITGNGEILLMVLAGDRLLKN
jgi:hypothetical protein